MCEKCKALAEKQSKSDFGPEMVSINENNVQLAHLVGTAEEAEKEKLVKGAEELERAVRFMHKATVEIVEQYVQFRKIETAELKIEPALQYIKPGIVNHMVLGLKVTMLSKEGKGINGLVMVIPVRSNLQHIADEIVRHYNQENNNTNNGGNK